MKVLAVLEQRDGQLKSSAAEAISTAYKVAGETSSDVAALVIGSCEGVDDLGKYGVDTVFHVKSADFDVYNVLTYTAAVAQAVETFKAEAVIAVASPTGKDLLARAAARLDAGYLSDLTALDFASGSLNGGTKPMYAGKVLAKVAFEGDSLRIAAIRPNVFPVVEASGNGAVEELAVSASCDGLKTVEIRKGSSDKPDLTEAVRIISGGRALGSAESFKILDDCADALGATVGASRAAVDSGYASHEMQVGQTGKTVNPSLYIACGISGSIQHMAGMRTSKVIVAVNTDPEAPIFKVADYGIVADLFEAVPAMTKEFSQLLK